MDLSISISGLLGTALIFLGMASGLTLFLHAVFFSDRSGNKKITVILWVLFILGTVEGLIVYFNGRSRMSSTVAHPRAFSGRLTTLQALLVCERSRFEERLEPATRRR